jgi:Ca-activated chloride channel family protein
VRAAPPVALAPVLLALGASAVQAQTPSPSPPPFTLEVSVDIVSVTAVVYDKGGHIIHGLGPKDVTLLEDAVPQEVSIFREAKGGDEKVPLSIVLVLDTSGSMKENLHFLQEAATSFVDKLTDVDSALVVSFNSSVKGSAEFTSDIDRLDEIIVGLQAWGGTSLYDAIRYGIDRIKDKAGRKAIVVFTDGDDTTSSNTEQSVIDFARATEATIYTLGIKPGGAPGMGGGPNKGFLKRVAEETGGEAFFPDRVGDLIKLFAAISEELHNHYLLAYSPKRGPDGTFRKIELRVDRKDAQVRVRKGYFAVKRPVRR